MSLFVLPLTLDGVVVDVDDAVEVLGDDVGHVEQLLVVETLVGADEHGEGDRGEVAGQEGRQERRHGRR